MKNKKELQRKWATAVMAMILIASFSSVQAQGGGLSGVASQFSGYADSIKAILKVIIGLVFIVGLIHVIASKSDKDPDKFKKLMQNYIMAIIFALIGLGLISVVTNAVV